MDQTADAPSVWGRSSWVASTTDAPGKAVSQTLTLIGLGLLVLGCLVTSTGMILLKYSASREQDRPWYKRGYGIVGLCCITAIPVPLNSAALTMVPLSMAGPFGGLTIVFSLALARLLPRDLREPFRKRKLVAVAILFSGVVVVTAFGPLDPGESKDPMDYLMTLWWNPPFVVLACTCLAGIFGLIGSWLLPGRWRPASGSLLNMVAVSFCAAACGAFATLLLKLVAESLSDVVKEQRAWIPGPPTALSLSCLAFFAPLELYLLNSLIAGSPVTFAVPLYESLLIVLNVSMGGAFFEEFASLGHDAGAFVAGVLLVGLGVCLLSLDHSDVHTSPPASNLIDALEEGQSEHDSSDKNGVMVRSETGPSSVLSFAADKLAAVTSSARATLWNSV